MTPVTTHVSIEVPEVGERVRVRGFIAWVGKVEGHHFWLENGLDFNAASDAWEVVPPEPDEVTVTVTLPRNEAEAMTTSWVDEDLASDLPGARGAARVAAALRGELNIVEKENT